MWGLHVYMCFELCLIHNWKAINPQRPQKYFYSSNKRTLLVGLFQRHNTISTEVVGCAYRRNWGGWGFVLLGFFFTCNDFLLERHWPARDRSRGGGSFVGKQN